MGARTRAREEEEGFGANRVSSSAVLLNLDPPRQMRSFSPISLPHPLIPGGEVGARRGGQTKEEPESTLPPIDGRTKQRSEVTSIQLTLAPEDDHGCEVNTVHFTCTEDDSRHVSREPWSVEGGGASAQKRWRGRPDGRIPGVASAAPAMSNFPPLGLGWPEHPETKRPAPAVW
jgi:hypothetical protein